MAKLIREQSSGILERREWWLLKNSCEGMTAYGEDICSIHITNQNKEDITKLLAEKIETKTKVSFSITATIDSFLIECKANDTPSLLDDLEAACQ